MYWLNSQFKTKMILLCFIAGLAGCSSLGGDGIAETRFYSLSALPPAPDAGNNALRIGIGPVEIPRLLNRPQIVTRKNNNEVSMSERHQWGGAYKEEIIQTLTDNLAALLKTERIERYPWRFGFKPAYQVRIDLEQLDGQPGAEVLLKARWRLIRDNREVVVKRAIIRQKVAGKDFSAYIKTQSGALAELSRQIAITIKKRP